MANRQRGELEIDLGGRSYTLKLSLNSMCEMEGASGRPFPQIVTQVARGSLTDLRAFLWAALREHHPDLTIQAVGDLIEKAGGLEGLAKTMTELVNRQREEGSENPQKGRGRGTGGRSTSTPGRTST